MNAMQADVNKPRISAMYYAAKTARDAARSGVEGAAELVKHFQANRQAIKTKWEELQGELDNFDMFADDPHPMSEEEKIEALLGVAKSAIPKGGRRTRRRKTRRRLTRNRKKLRV
jgi:hypothetical protein